MKGFLVKVVLFFIGLVGLSKTIDSLLPYHYGNWTFACKERKFTENKDQLNTLFFGSSRIYRQIVPSYFDSILQPEGVKSFNLGSPATFNPESWYLYSNVIKAVEPGEIRYAFMEMQPITPVSDENVGAIRGYYWLGLKDLALVARYFHDNKRAKVPGRFLKNYILNYFESTFNFEKVKYLDGIKDCERNKGVSRNGFYPLEMDLKDHPGNKKLKERRVSFLEDTSVNRERFESSLIQLADYDYRSYQNDIVIAKLKELIRMSEEKGIRLIFIIPPRMKDYREMRAVAASLPSGNQIDLASGEKYPEFYQTRYAFDKAHLNSPGAYFFTKRLATEFRKMISE